ncbi:MAG: hypothetical protein GEU90_06970 [Gemmatimonas sp.]|nr:hypothetical protein [Gemmatimonas sp.]
MMTTLFLACAGLGASVLVLQILLSAVGLDHGHSSLDVGLHGGDAGLDEGLSLLSVRSVAAGVAFFGLGGLAAMAIGLAGPIAVLVALLPGVAALAGTAVLMRQLVRLESSGTIRIERAVGAAGTVYLTIPGGHDGPGKVHLTLQGRTVELQAVSPDGSPIPTGAPVVVVSVIDSDTVEVIPTSLIEEVLE